MYATENFRSKAALKAAVKEYNETGQRPVTIFAPGLGTPKVNGVEYLEGPHYPKPHTWYAQVTMRDGVVIAVK